MNAMHQTAVSFTGQNLGGKQFDRINKVLFQCLAIVMVVGLVFGNGAAFFGRYILRLYSSDGEVIGYGKAGYYLHFLLPLRNDGYYGGRY